LVWFSYMRAVCIFFTFILFVQSDLFGQAFRKWTSSDGREIKATFIEENKGLVSIRGKDGRLFKIPLDKFSDADKKFIRSLSFDPLEGLVAWYPFNGNAQDESGNGHHGKVIGAKLCKDRKGKVDSAYSFDGLNDYIDLGKDQKLNPRNEMTMSAWIMIDRELRSKKGNDLVRSEPIIERYQPNAGRRSYFLEILSDRKLRSAFFQDGGTPKVPRFVSSQTTSLLNLNKHYFVAVTYIYSRGGNIFLNGKTISEIKYGEPIQQTNESTCLGGILNSKSKYFTGVIDEARIYDRALNQDEINFLYELEK
jgi:hypothetical protein